MMLNKYSHLTAFFISSSVVSGDPEPAPSWVARAAMLKRTQAFSYSRLVVIVYWTLPPSQEPWSKQSNHLK